MNEIKGNIWDHVGKVQAIYVNTNLAYKSNGDAVMGLGMALVVKQRWPNVPNVLGSSLAMGNYNPIPLWRIGDTNCPIRTELWSFPTKDIGRRVFSEEELDALVTAHNRHKMNTGNYVPSWAQKSSMERIVKSAQYIQASDIQSGILARPGCGAGELEWEEVSEALHSILDDRFSVISW